MIRFLWFQPDIVKGRIIRPHIWLNILHNSLIWIREIEYYDVCAQNGHNCVTDGLLVSTRTGTFEWYGVFCENKLGLKTVFSKIHVGASFASFQLGLSLLLSTACTYVDDWTNIKSYDNCCFDLFFLTPNNRGNVLVENKIEKLLTLLKAYQNQFFAWPSNFLKNLNNNLKEVKFLARQAEATIKVY